jgi:hypothetical protein
VTASKAGKQGTLKKTTLAAVNLIALLPIFSSLMLNSAMQSSEWFERSNQTTCHPFSAEALVPANLRQ